MAYSSKYYDPVKAHEYYMKHRKLKGRKRGSTRDLNEQGKAAAEMIKKQITEERKEAVKKLNDEMKSKIDRLRKSMKNRLKGLSGRAKERLKEQLKEEIASLREEYKSQKDAVKEEFNEKYIQEVENMTASGEFQKERKPRKRRNK